MLYQLSYAGKGISEPRTAQEPFEQSTQQRVYLKAIAKPGACLRSVAVIVFDAAYQQAGRLAKRPVFLRKSLGAT